MGEHVDLESEDQMILEEHYTPTMKIDPKRFRFPCCIVWTPLPVISWLIPFIGHMGICREDGVIMDFAGPNFVSVDNFAFGAVARYIQIDKDKECSLFPRSSSFHSGDEYNNLEAPPTDKVAYWDDALKKSTQEYQHHLYSLFTCNCHSFVANSVNRLGFLSGGWNVVNLAALMFLKGQWVSTGAMIRSYLPFTIVFCSGVLFWGATFLTFLAFFASLLVGWFLVGTYLVKDVIQL